MEFLSIYKFIHIYRLCKETLYLLLLYVDTGMIKLMDTGSVLTTVFK